MNELPQVYDLQTEKMRPMTQADANKYMALVRFAGRVSEALKEVRACFEDQQAG